MKKIATLAAIAALTTLAACGTAEAPAEAVATEAAANEAVATEVGKPANEHVEAAAPAADSK